MDVYKAIEKRHSYRGVFKDKEIPRDELQRIVEAGLRAPSGYNDQTTSIVVVDDGEKIRKLGSILANDHLSTAPSVFVLCMEKDTGKRDQYFGVQNYAAVCENITLAAVESGYATVWIDGALTRDDRAGQIADLLDIPDTHEVRVVLPLGVPEESWDQKEKKTFGENAWFNRFGGAS